MALDDDLLAGVDAYLGGNYEITQGYVIPSVDDIAFGPSGRSLDMTMLFIDIHSSTDIVDAFRRQTAAKMYKSFIWGVTRIARENGGDMLSFNGDGLLVGFAGEHKEKKAAKTAMNLVWFGNEALKPKLQTYFTNNRQAQALSFDFGIGIHTGTVLVVRAGIRGENNNDLVWVGNVTNFAAKLAGEARYPYNIRTSFDAHYAMDDEYKTHPSGNRVWSAAYSDALATICYENDWWWRPGTLWPTAGYLALLRLLGSGSR